MPDDHGRGYTLPIGLVALNDHFRMTKRSDNEEIESEAADHFEGVGGNNGYCGVALQAHPMRTDSRFDTGK